MKKVGQTGFSLFVLIISMNLLCQPACSQSLKTSDLKQCKELVDDAQYFLHEAANQIQLCDGASSVEDLKYYCFESLSSIDSVDFKLQEALFKTDDIGYSLKNNKDSLISFQVDEISKNLQEAQKSNSATQKILGLLLDETRSAVINQKLFDLGETITSCSSQINQAQRLLKDLNKKPKH